MSVITLSIKPDDGRVEAGAEDGVDDDRAVADFGEVQLPRLAVRDFHDGQAEAPEDVEIDPRVAAHVATLADEEHRHADAALRERSRDDEAVAAVVAAAAKHGDVPVEQVAVDRFHRRDDLASGVLHQHERGDADLLDRPPIGFAHLRGVEDSHRQQALHRQLSRRESLRGMLRCMAATVNVNGRVFDQEHAVVSVFDHGFLYGEGVYETLRTFNGQPFLFDRHMQRLRNSAGMLHLSVPLADEELSAAAATRWTPPGSADGGTKPTSASC